MSPARNTIPVITKYELACLLSVRATEIASGQPITIKDPGTTDPVEIARLEFSTGKSPKKVLRTWPDGTVECWSLSELKVIVQN
uniref:RNA polymerase subunit 6 n=1 Tax=Marseillevirus LCMAC201 TaxID=2506605 RepID=A0A481YVS4_9VIRU|nr:MAG: RNA polymerase subunit 6 [Marseillevirus LCMAC201]